MVLLLRSLYILFCEWQCYYALDIDANVYYVRTCINDGNSEGHDAPCLMSIHPVLMLYQLYPSLLEATFIPTNISISIIVSND